MKRRILAILVCLIITFFTNGTIAQALESDVQPGFPSDFPTIMDTGGLGQGQSITGFGGLKTADPGKTLQQTNRDHITHTPVILLHGNAGNALHEDYVHPLTGKKHEEWDFGMHFTRDFLIERGYPDAGIWAASYLGEGNNETQHGAVVSQNLPDVRKFIDAVMDYLGVDKVDIIAHSIGVSLAIGYIKGFQGDGIWNYADNRLDKICTFVSLAGANYGIPSYGINDGDYTKGSEFERGAHKFNGIIDDTPYGAPEGEQTSFDNAWKKTSSLDEIAHDRIYYVAVISRKGYIDGQEKDTSHLVGADLNVAFTLPGPEFESIYVGDKGLTRHSQTLRNQEVFDNYFTYLNKCAGPARSIKIEPHGGEFDNSMDVTISASEGHANLQYRMNSVSWQDITSGSSTTITQTSALEAKATFNGVERSTSASFVKCDAIPSISFAPDDITFSNKLEVAVSASLCATEIEYKINDGAVQTDSGNKLDIPIENTTTIEARGHNTIGWGSWKSSTFTKKPYEEVCSTIFGHLFGGRISMGNYFHYFGKHGFSSFCMYKVNDTWTDEPYL